MLLMALGLLNDDNSFGKLIISTTVLKKQLRKEQQNTGADPKIFELPH